MFNATKVICLALALACLLAGSVTLALVDQGRARLVHFTPQAGAPKAPEVVLLTNLLGGFRGLLVDMLWMRATKLQQENKFWELYQLYDWIGKLEPHLEEVWVHNGWNMSYNLVAELSNAEARWQWIERGIEWMRDEGLEYNPSSYKIMGEIAWIYFHKLGRDMDTHQNYYKHRWALIMQNVVGIREMQDIKAILDASQKYESFADLWADPDVAAALAEFQLSPPGPEIRHIEEQVTEGAGLSAIPPSVIAALLKAASKAEKARAETDEAADGETTEKRDAWTKVRSYIASRVLREVFKIKRLDLLVKIEEELGDMDWRLPDPHAIYWSYLARETAVNQGRDPQALIKFDRIITFSVQEVLRRGVIAYVGPDPNTPLVVTFDMDKIEYVGKRYQFMLDFYNVENDVYGAESVRDGHITFLQEMSFDLYFAGYPQRAKKYYLQLKALYDKPSPFVPLNEYALGQVKKFVEENATFSKMRAFVGGLINQTCIWLVFNRPDQARNYENLAREAWVAYRNYEIANRQREAIGRSIPEWDEFLRVNILHILSGNSPVFPREYLPKLAQILGIKQGTPLEEMDWSGGLAPPPEVVSSPDKKK